MSDFDLLAKEVNDGLNGRNAGIPMGFDRLNKYISLRRANTYLIGGYTGSGKTSLLDDAFVLNPVDWWMHNKDKSQQRIKVIYWSMERRKGFKLGKWICRRIFLDHGVIISLPKLMGWGGEKMSSTEHDYFLMYEDYINEFLEHVTIIERPQNPMGIKKYMDDYALKNGTVEKIDDYHTIYHPNDPNLITEVVYDHLGLQKGEKRKEIIYRSKKEIIDLSSEDARHFRDFYGFSPIQVSQFNRDIANPTRIKNGDVEPMLEDFKESGNTQEDADIVLALFDPMRYNVPDPAGYNLDKLRDSEGRKMYRSLKILKNTYGADDIQIGLAFQPVVGHFKEMPKKPFSSDLPDSVYETIQDSSYFLPLNNKRV